MRLNVCAILIASLTDICIEQQQLFFLNKTIKVAVLSRKMSYFRSGKLSDSLMPGQKLTFE